MWLKDMKTCFTNTVLESGSAKRRSVRSKSRGGSRRKDDSGGNDWFDSDGEK
jgi:hypothetical protein